MNNTLTAHTQSKSGDCKAGQSIIRNPSSPPALIDDSNDHSSSNNSNNNAADVNVDVDDAILLRRYPDLPTLFRLQDVPSFFRSMMTKEKLESMLQNGYFALSQPLTTDMVETVLKTTNTFFDSHARRVHTEVLVLKAYSTIDDDTDHSRAFRKELFDRMCESVEEPKVFDNIRQAEINRFKHKVDSLDQGRANHTRHNAARSLYNHRLAWICRFLTRFESEDASGNVMVRFSELHHRFLSQLLRNGLEKLSAAEVSPIIRLCLAYKNAQLSYASNSTVLHKIVVNDLLGRRKVIAKEMEKLYIMTFLRNEDFEGIARFAIKRMLAEMENTATEASDADGVTGERPLKKIKKEGTPV